MIAKAHGTIGELKVIPLTDNPDRYRNLKWVYIKKEMAPMKYFIEFVRFMKDFVIVKLKGIDDMDSANALKGLFLEVDRENAVKLPEGSYFICDLIGASVHDETGNLLGTLTDVIKTGSNDVFVIKAETGNEMLVPALKTVVKVISPEEGKITVKLPEGLIDDEI